MAITPTHSGVETMPTGLMNIHGTGQWFTETIAQRLERFGESPLIRQERDLLWDVLKFYDAIEQWARGGVMLKKVDLDLLTASFVVDHLAAYARETFDIGATGAGDASAVEARGLLTRLL
jgi:hypothetical protein